MKRKFGEQSSCHRCGQDIEFHGREHGWIDRGANRECPAYIKGGEVIKPKGLKHSPVTARHWLG